MARKREEIKPTDQIAERKAYKCEHYLEPMGNRMMDSSKVSSKKIINEIERNQR